MRCLHVRIGICEDNHMEADNLLGVIKRWRVKNGVPVATRVFSSAEDFLIHTTEFEYDMLFLDIQMGDITGMPLAKMIREKDEHIVLVFLTALGEYSLEGYEVNALNYLLKPVDETACSAVLDKAKTIIYARRDQFIMLGKDDGRMRFALKDIYYIDSSGHYIVVHSTSGDYRFRRGSGRSRSIL